MTGARVIFILFSVFLATSAETYYVHRPDARVYGHASYAIGAHIAPEGGLLVDLGVGFFDRFHIGLSYGGDNIVGTGQVNWYPAPGVQAKVAILDETKFPLSLAIGFDSQDPPGSNAGQWQIPDVNPAGFYLVAGKLIPVGWVAFDLGIGGGYDIIDENAMHLYAVSGLVFADVFSLTPELTVYPQRDNGGNIDLALAARWEFYRGAGIELILADLLEGFEEGWTRSLRFQIVQEF